MTSSFVIWGPLACFSRPESPDRFTYPIPTPSALAKIVGCIYDHPGLLVDIQRIRVLRPIRMLRLGLVQVANVASLHAAGNRAKPPPLDKRPSVQTVLRDSAWQVDFEYRLHPYATETHSTPNKAHAIFDRRVAKGQFYYPPTLGLHDYRASFRPVTDEDRPIQQSRDFGQVFHGFDYWTGRYPKPLVFHAMMKDGVILVPSFWKRLTGLTGKEAA